MDIKYITLDDFLLDCNISREDWALAGIDFEDLKAIGEDHEQKKEALNKEAEYIAARLQKFL